jgi:hypothetical protein
MKPKVAVPDQMKHLPLDRRGYPIFFGALRGPDGKPYFTVNDDRKRELMIAHDLCSVCGRKLTKFRWFAGGPRSAFDPRGAYIDMPMHGACVHYALQVCPYLALPNYGRNIDMRQAEIAEAGTERIILHDPTMIPDRPEVFVAVLARGQVMTGGFMQQYVRPRRPYVRIEHWRHGRMLTPAEVSALPLDMQGIGATERN